MHLALGARMRLLGLALLLAACTEAGAHLTLSAPDGPGSVMSFRVVLATPETVPSITGQRVAPDDYAVQSVSYYLQRTVAGGEHEMITELDGFAIRIEPDISISDTQFIPFVLMYDGVHGTGNIIGVATFRASDSMIPAPILVKRDEIDKYTLAVEPVVQVGDTDAVEPGQVRVVTCKDQRDAEIVSGIVWRPKQGSEVRVLFPLDEGLDATGRPLDLDCDDHVVAIESSGADCDDSRGWFHRDAVETCDGYDTNCDYQQTIVVACAGSPNLCNDPMTNTGIALCSDRDGGSEGQCQSDPQCLCNGAGGAGCMRCMIANDLASTAGTVRACQPSVG